MESQTGPHNQRVFRTLHLTGALNRQAYLDQSVALIEDNPAGAIRDVAIIMIDLDHFKALNDTHGHFVGDKALNAAAQSISSALLPHALFGRLGGEEFAITLLEENREKIFVTSEKIRLSIENTIVENEFGDHIKITASLGLYISKNNDVDSIVSRLRKADIALYQAKSQGRNRIWKYSDTCEKPEFSTSHSDEEIFLRRNRLNYFESYI